MKEKQSIFDLSDEDIKKLDNEFMEGYNEKLKVDYVSDYNLEYAYNTDSGFDLRSDETFVLGSLDRKLTSTTTKIDIPKGYELQIRPKSGLAIKKGLSVLNTPGTVDNSYTGEIKIILVNLSNEEIKINKGDKIAQGVFCKVIQGHELDFIKKDNIKEKDRGENGFGSTGN